MSITNEDIEYLDKYFVLQRVTQEQIFQHYMGMAVDVSTTFCSPIRRDRHPTCTMKYIGGKLLFRDWSEPKSLDCFDFVQKCFSCSYGTALEIIARDFGLKNRFPDKEIPRVYQQVRNKRKKTKKRIRVRVQPVTKVDANYLRSYGLTQESVNKFRCFSIKHIWIQSRPYYQYREVDPALGYYLGSTLDGDQRWKIYFYERQGAGRFIGNTNRFNGWVQLPLTGKLIVITKSMKDVMVLDAFGIPAIAMQTETMMPYQRIVDSLKERFKEIVIFYDFDYTGINGAHKIRKEFNIPAIFLTNGRFATEDFGSKDISDYVKANGVIKTEELLIKAAKFLSLNLIPKYRL